MRRIFVLAAVIAMVLVLSAGNAFAHPNSSNENEFPAAGKSQAFADCESDIDPLFCAGVFDRVGENAVNGILQGFVNHSPMCTEHYYESLGGQDHGNEP